MHRRRGVYRQITFIHVLDIEGGIAMKKISLNDAITEAYMEEFARDPDILIFGDNSTTGCGCSQHSRLDNAYPDRVMNMPLNEVSYPNFGLGMALGGLRPIVEYDFQDFLTLGFDGIVNQVAKVRFWSHGTVKAPMTIMAAGGISGGIGCNHSQQAEAWFANVPGLKICIPSTAADAKGLLKTAIRDDDPVLFIFYRSLSYAMDYIPEEEYLIPMGKARIQREGTDVTLVCWHLAYAYARSLAAELEEDGISVEIIDPLTLNPFDKETVVNSVKKTGRLVVAHEAPYKFGVSAEIIAEVMEECMGDLITPPIRACSPRTAVPSGSAEWRVMLSKNDIRKAVYKVMDKAYPDKPEYHKSSTLTEVTSEYEKAIPDGSVFSLDGAIFA
jgi:pyruvate dehydrogenase E1 component beta subunit